MPHLVDNNAFASLVELDGQGLIRKNELEEKQTKKQGKKRRDPAPGAKRPPPHGKGPGPYE